METKTTYRNNNTHLNYDKNQNFSKCKICYISSIYKHVSI